MLPLNRKRNLCALGLAISITLLIPWGALSSAAVEPDRPNLLVTSVSDPPASVLPGDSFALDITVENHGTASANATLTLVQISTKFYLVAGSVKKNLKGVQMLALPSPSRTIAAAHM